MKFQIGYLKGHCNRKFFFFWLDSISMHTSKTLHVPLIFDSVCDLANTGWRIGLCGFAIFPIPAKVNFRLPIRHIYIRHTFDLPFLKGNALRHKLHKPFAFANKGNIVCVEIICEILLFYKFQSYFKDSKDSLKTQNNYLDRHFKHTLTKSQLINKT